MQSQGWSRVYTVATSDPGSSDVIKSVHSGLCLLCVAVGCGVMATAASVDG
jgi:hypothetical protein